MIFFKFININILIFILGTPLYQGNWNEIIEKAKHEADIYKKYKVVRKIYLLRLI